jgi:hypothetical protein
MKKVLSGFSAGDQAKVMYENAARLLHLQNNQYLLCSLGAADMWRKRR